MIGLIGLGDEIVGAGLHRLEGLGRVAERGQHDHADRQALGAHLVAAGPCRSSSGIRKSVMSQVELLRLQVLPGRSAVADGFDFEAVGFEDLARDADG